MSTPSASQVTSFQLHAALTEMAARTIDGETPTPINPTAFALAIFRFLVGA
jgi:hypothetical protein